MFGGGKNGVFELETKPTERMQTTVEDFTVRATPMIDLEILSEHD